MNARDILRKHVNRMIASGHQPIAGIDATHNVEMVKVYAADRETVLAEVPRTSTSIGAAKAARMPACYRAWINDKVAWVATELR